MTEILTTFAIYFAIMFFCRETIAWLINWLAKWLVIGWDKARMYFEKEPPPLTNADLEKIAKMLHEQSGAPPMPSRQIIIDGFKTLSPDAKRSIKRSMGCIARYSQNHGEYFSFTVRT